MRYGFYKWAKAMCCACYIAFKNDTVAKRALQVSYLGIELSFLSSATWPKTSENVCAEILKALTRPESFPKTYGTTRVPKSTVHNIIKKHHAKCYKPYMVHGLLEDDPDKRVEFWSRIIKNYEFDNIFVWCFQTKPHGIVIV